jgi:hypothetical protein
MTAAKNETPQRELLSHSADYVMLSTIDWHPPRNPCNLRGDGQGNGRPGKRSLVHRAAQVEPGALLIFTSRRSKNTFEVKRD